MRAVAILIAALVLAGCAGAGYNPGCEGKEEKTEWCRYNPP